MKSDALNRNALSKLLGRWSWLYSIRPQSLAEPLYRLIGAKEGRVIINAAGARLFIDPFTTAGYDIARGEQYEPDFVALLHQSLTAGSCFLDIGANEGIFSAIAARIVGGPGTGYIC